MSAPFIHDRRPRAVTREHAGSTVLALELTPVALAIAALRALPQRPAILVAGTAALVCLPPGPAGGPQDVTVAPADLGVVCLVAVILARLVLGRDVAALRPYVLIAPVGVAVAALAATLTADDQAQSLLGTVRFMEIFVALPLAVALSLRTRSDVLIVLGGLVGVGVFEGVIGTHQFLTGSGAGIGLSDVRAVGTFGAYNIMGLANAVSTAALICFAWALGARRGRGLAALLAIALCLPLAFSLSRGLWLASAVAAAVTLATSGARRTVIVAPAAVAIGVVALSVAPGGGSSILGERAGSIGTSFAAPDRSVQDRYDLWATAAAISRDHWVTGVGLRNFAEYRDRYAPLSLSTSSDIDDPAAGFQRVQLLSPHNMYLLFFSEQGVIGLAALLTLVGLPLFAVVGRLRRARAPGLHRVVALVAVGFAARFLVNSIWADVGGTGEIVMGILFGILLWGAAARTGTPGRSGSDASPTDLVTP